MKIVGFKRFESKKGKNCCMMSVVEPYSKKDNERGYFGSSVQDLFMPDDLYDFLEEKHIGHDVQLDYKINQGRAYLEDVTVK